MHQKLLQKAAKSIADHIAKSLKNGGNLPEPELVQEFRLLAAECAEPGDYEKLLKEVGEFRRRIDIVYKNQEVMINALEEAGMLPKELAPVKKE